MIVAVLEAVLFLADLLHIDASCRSGRRGPQSRWQVIMVSVVCHKGLQDPNLVLGRPGVLEWHRLLALWLHLYSIGIDRRLHFPPLALQGRCLADLGEKRWGLTRRRRLLLGSLVLERG